MTTCIKCGYTRQETDTAPEWQCPSCEVAYVKAAKAIALEQSKHSEEAHKIEVQERIAAEKAKQEKSTQEQQQKKQEADTLKEAEKTSHHSSSKGSEPVRQILKKPINGGVVLLLIVFAILAFPFIATDGVNPLSMGGFIFLFMALGAIGFYFLPWLIALGRGHNASVLIFLINLLLGWTLLFWIICLVWSLSSNTNQQVIVIKK